MQKFILGTVVTLTLFSLNACRPGVYYPFATPTNANTAVQQPQGHAMPAAATVQAPVETPSPTSALVPLNNAPAQQTAPETHRVNLIIPG